VLALAFGAILEFEFEFVVEPVPSCMHPDKTIVVSAIPATKATVHLLLIPAYDIISSFENFIDLNFVARSDSTLQQPSTNDGCWRLL
jgi:hypothetical protein